MGIDLGDPAVAAALEARPEPRVFCNTGYDHLSWTLSAATALIVAAAELGTFRLHVGAGGVRGLNARKTTARARVR